MGWALVGAACVCVCACMYARAHKRVHAYVCGGGRVCMHEHSGRVHVRTAQWEPWKGGLSDSAAWTEWCGALPPGLGLFCRVEVL